MVFGGSSLLDPAFLQRLERLHLAVTRAHSLTGQWRGTRRTRHEGTGIEFADHRGYTAGDDLRRVDWAIYRRLGRLLVRRFEEERDLRVYLFVDASRSMAGADERSKLACATSIASALAFLALSAHDEVACIAYRDGVVQRLPFQHGRNRIGVVLRFLAGLSPDGGTDARSAFSEFLASRSGRGVAIVISDFLDARGFRGSLDLLRSHRHDVSLVHVVSPADDAPSASGDVRFADSETGENLDLSITSALIRSYDEQRSLLARGLEEYCRRYGFRYACARSADSLETSVLALARQGWLAA